MKSLKRASLHDVDRIDDVSERLGHLPSVSVSNHGVAVDLGEGHLSGELDSEEDHPSDPEEDDVPSGLEEGSGVEVSEIGGLSGKAESG